MARDAGTTAGRALVDRVLGVDVGGTHIVLRDLDTDPSGRDSFEVTVTAPDNSAAEDAGPTVELAGTSPLAQATALRWHLADPGHSSGLRPAAFQYRYHYNFCTFGYQTAFWDWAQWERELDHLAMAGVNLPLAVVGQEAVWLRVLRRLEMSDDAIRRFLGGPAYLPWLLMGCMADWDGPMPQAWIDSHAELGVRIVERMRDLGMCPVLPSFAGHVPGELAARASADDAGSVEQIVWAGFRTHLLRPSAPLFAELTALHLEEQTAMFGTDHFYAADPFIEVVPEVTEPEQVAAVAAAIHTGMTRHDPEAVWVFQSWPFTYHESYWTHERRRAFLSAVPSDRLLVLDLWADHRPVADELEPRVPWIWSMVNNFGGRPGLYGNLARLATSPAEGLRNGARGVGAAMEDRSTNDVVWDLLADVGWHGEVDLESWLADWVRHRYAGLPPARIDAAVEAWRLLRTAMFDSAAPGPPSSVMGMRPRVHEDLTPPQWRLSEAPRLDSVPLDLVSALRMLAGEATGPADPPLPRGPHRDLVDVAYAVISLSANLIQSRAVEAFTAGDAVGFEAASADLLTAFDDAERVLATCGDYLLGRWLAEARRWGDTPDEQRYYASDALRLITLWGPPDGSLVDYARRGWSGLLGGLYTERWRLWVEELRSCLLTGASPDAKDFTARIRALDSAFVDAPPNLPTSPTGDVGEIVRSLLPRYLPHG